MLEHVLRRSRSLFASFLLGVSLVGCGGAAPPASPPLAAPVAGIAESRPDLAPMLTELVAVEFCDQVRGRFLPIAHTRNGRSPRGDEPVGGRWWVRDCRAQVHQGQLAISLDGIGWAWAEGEEDIVIAGWGMAEYAYFTASGTVVGQIDLPFDPGRGVGWIRFRPSARPYVNTTTTKRVEAHGDFGAAVLSIITLGFASGRADEKANDTVRKGITEAFRGKLGAGFAIEFDVQRRQRDLVTLDAIVSPLRPFADGTRWLVNERQVLHRKPGGVHVNGPYAPTQTAGVDFRVLDGIVSYRVECEHDVVAWFDRVARGAPPMLGALTHAQAGVVSVGTTYQTLASMCPWYLVTEPVSERATVDVRVRADKSGYPLPGP